ncbi:hypothetical protein M0805_003178 [Coniferiporia weirii]|nr:hypothetical protein M0805_003178 [Coniferiporia weirii]
MDLADVVESAMHGKDASQAGGAVPTGTGEHANRAHSTHRSIPNGDASASTKWRRVQTDGIDARRVSSDSQFPPSSALSRTPHDSPSSRTGPPRSLSYNLARSPRLSPQGMRGTEDDGDAPYEGGLELEEIAESRSDLDATAGAGVKPSVSRTRSEFRGALEYIDPEQREKEREAAEKREKNRLSRIVDETWVNPLKWLNGQAPEPVTHESPKDDGEGWTSYFDFLKPGEKGKEKETQQQEGEEKAPTTTDPEKQAERTENEEKPIDNRDAPQESPSPTKDEAARKAQLKGKGVARAQSMPHMKRSTSRKNSFPAPRWARLRSLLPLIAQQNKNNAPQGQTAVQSHLVNITDELISGGLSALMLKLWFERDERGARRVPVLLHHLRLRISDSIHPLNGNKAVFRIECEYANGAARWVIYRQLRDFVSLHTHYRVSHAFNRNVEALPEFPRTSLPYFKFLKKEGRENDQNVEKSDFAIIQREALENYLIGLIRAVMFHPTSNRLAGFLEISALSIHLAQSGGWQAKAGMLTIEAASKKSGGFGRKNASWSERKKQRWCAVRESYLVAVDDPGELTVWDVFMLDSDFRIERPKRYYRQGLNLLHHETFEPPRKAQEVQRTDAETHSTLGKVKAKVGRALHFRVGGRHTRMGSTSGRHSTTVASIHRSRSRPRSGSVSSSGSSNASTHMNSEPALVDPSTNLNAMRAGEHDENDNTLAEPTDLDDLNAGQDQKKTKGKKRSKDVSKHTFFVSNSQMRLKLFAKNERQMQQWIIALEKIAYTSHWTGGNRFGSFAPIRLNVAAQWLVDGRDYMWNLSRAILLARERIYIHDWWLSPELQLRRPHKERYRLDRLLEQKAKEGVKIYIILYQEVSNRTTPTDSNYTKQRLTALHPNIMVQRSPSHFQTGTFYWAHHEKLCVIDEAIAFTGGVDLCFGRWDTPQHVLIDDPDPSDENATQIWPGKDYSNARISDFFTLNKPYEDMYNRQKIPRMPWHDVGMQIVGQPARDLCRHFVQRWNYLLRIKNHSRTMPFLLPPPDFKARDLQEQGLTGTCEIQICRSCGPWSMGTPTKVEHSIQNAYLKAIQMSDHFVYIENQFFITSTTVNDTPVENKIGDALVHRIIRAYREGTKWKACIMIPLLPGFPFSVDHSDASSVRIILECQNRTICRGPNSIFARLRKEGIDPDEYISVFSLRNWGKLPGNVLTSEMVYIHGKVCIVDDRLAIIGSANINERSQRGDRDSELAAIVRDTDMIDGTMNGIPYKVGRFAHTLRVRLMREHIGVDVDAMYEEDLMAADPVMKEEDIGMWDPSNEQHVGTKDGVTHAGQGEKRTAAGEAFGEIKDSVEQAIHGSESDAVKDFGYYVRKAGIKSKHTDASADDKQLEEERQKYTRDGKKVPGFASAVVPTLEEKTIIEHRPPPDQASGDKPIEDAVDGNTQDGGPPEARVHDGSGELFGAPADASKDPRTDDEPPHARSDESDVSEEEKAAVQARRVVRKHLSANASSKPWTLPTPTPEVDPHGFEDPVSDKFWKNVWVACAVHNTEIFRKVFHCIPDDTVTTWKQYKEFVLHHERLNKPVKEQSNPSPAGRVPSEAGDEDTPGQGRENGSALRNDGGPKQGELKPKRSVHDGGSERQSPSQTHSQVSGAPSTQEDIRRTPTRADEPFEKWERDDMEALLGELRGHLVLYPTRFLEGEDVSNNFLFNADRLMPMPIYN